MTACVRARVGAHACTLEGAVSRTFGVRAGVRSCAYICIYDLPYLTI